jgi:Lrp/AsnC family transcriptional regulator for asnA, asnC and gidA
MVVIIPKIKIDERDIRIIRTLEKDARTSFADIARDCGVSIDTITKRYKKMVSAGILKRTTLILNPESFGFGCIASLEIDADFSQIEGVIDTISEVPGIIFITPSVGRGNLFAIAFLGDVGELNQLNAFLKSIPWVNEVKSSLWVGRISPLP